VFVCYFFIFIINQKGSSMSVNFNPNDSSSQAYRKEFFADLRYYDLLKNMNVFSSSEESRFLQEKWKKTQPDRSECIRKI